MSRRHRWEWVWKQGYMLPHGIVTVRRECSACGLREILVAVGPRGGKQALYQRHGEQYSVSMQSCRGGRDE